MPDPPGDTGGEFDLDSQCEIVIDAWYQRYIKFDPELEEIDYNVFCEGYNDSTGDENGSMGVTLGVFKDAAVDVGFADRWYIEWSTDSIFTDDHYVTLWQYAHFQPDSGRGDTLSYFMCSINRHGYDAGTGLTWDRIGGITITEDCNPGTRRNITPDTIIFMLLCHVVLHSAQETTWHTGHSEYRDLLTAYSHRVWGIAMAHELGHFYACLSEWESIIHGPGPRCIMRQYRLSDFPDCDLGLQNPSFCDSCKNFIKMAYQQ